jgi:hypothetical protein
LSIKNTQRIILNLCIFLTSMLLTLAAPAEIYKWVDAEGKVHYGEKSPNKTTGKAVETIKIKNNVGASDAQRASDAIKKKSKSLDESRKKRKKEKKDTLVKKEKLAKKKKQCEDAKKLLVGVQMPRVALTDGDEYVWLDEEQKKEKIKAAKVLVKELCNY